MLLSVFAVKALPTVPTRAFASHERQLPVEQPVGLNLLLKSHVVDISFWIVRCCSRLIHVLSCHIVILFLLLILQRLHQKLFHVLPLLFLIPQRPHHEFFQISLFERLIHQQAHHEFLKYFLLQLLIRRLVLHEFTHVLISVFVVGFVHPSRSS